MAKIARARVDQLNSQRLAPIHPVVAEKAVAFIGMCESHLGIKVFVISGLRTFEEQEVLYSKGRYGKYKKNVRVTNAKPGQSFHNYGLAIDHLPLIQLSANMFELTWSKESFLGPALQKTRKLAVSMGFETIRNDRPHLQFRDGWAWQELKAIGYGQTLSITEIPLPKNKPEERGEQ